MDDARERIELYQVEVRRLDELNEHLDKLLLQAPRYWYAALAAPIVWFFAGGGWAFVELLVTAALVGTQTYLLRTRKTENRWNRATIVEDIDRLKAEIAARDSLG